MIAEANHLTGVMIREYIWRDDTPIALVVYSANGSTSTVYDIHADHLNRPQKITTQNASVVWDGVFDPFGNPSGITGSVTMPLMFPGQYWDSETQLSQNWNRDYDPTIGRYIESDPIGLWGGVNTYTYVADKPLRYVDLQGTGPLGGYIGGFLGAALGGAGGEAVDPLGGGLVGGWEGWDEGYAIGSGLEDIMSLMASSSGDNSNVIPFPNRSSNQEPCPPDNCESEQKSLETAYWIMVGIYTDPLLNLPARVSYNSGVAGYNMSAAIHNQRRPNHQVPLLPTISLTVP